MAVDRDPSGRGLGVASEAARDEGAHREGRYWLIAASVRRPASVTVEWYVPRGRYVPSGSLPSKTRVTVPAGSDCAVEEGQRDVAVGVDEGPRHGRRDGSSVKRERRRLRQAVAVLGIEQRLRGVHVAERRVDDERAGDGLAIGARRVAGRQA